jgi:HSP20 family protein
MRGLLHWDPFQEMAAFPEANNTTPAFNPAFEVKETRDGYLFRADVPGVKEPDLEIALTGNRLTITGKRETEEVKADEKFYAFERTFGSFTRSFTLPNGADAEHTKAELKDGVLTLQVPKMPEVQPKKITLKAEKPKA